MTDAFDSPSSGIKITDYEGQLLLVTPHEVEKDISTAYGPADAISCTIAVLDGEDAGETFEAVRVFQKALQGQVRPKVGTGRMVLGRLGKGTAKSGQSAPWLLAEPTEEDKKVARDFLAKDDNPPY